MANTKIKWHEERFNAFVAELVSYLHAHPRLTTLSNDDFDQVIGGVIHELSHRQRKAIDNDEEMSSDMPSSSQSG
ncbi:MAG TPA: hypothetical protein VGQ13_05210 [Nitrososphaera sp.]|nr:hypothetical protein [Nitrososphaera sp.]